MAPTPYTPNGKLQIHYFVDTLDHHQDLPVNIVDTGGGVYKIVNNQPGGANKTGVEFTDQWWTYASAFYNSTTTAPLYTLYLRSGAVFTPVDSGAGTGGPGTNTGTNFLATQLTFTFKDENNKRQNIALFETCYEAPGKSGINTTPAPFTAFINQFIVSTFGFDLRDVVRSRGDGTPTRFLRWTNTLSRVQRKRRNLS